MGWIRVGKALPKRNKRVLVTVRGSDIVIPKDGETIEECLVRQYEEMARIEIAFIGSDGWYSDDYFPMVITPSAWMPLPKPWKGE